MSKITIVDQNSPEVQYLCKRDKRLKKVISMVGPLEYKTKDDPFAFLIHEIIEQMLSIKAANKIYSKLLDLCDGTISPDVINNLTFEQIKSVGTSSAKANYIIDVTKAVINEELVFNNLSNLTDEEVVKQLTKLRGIGNWTAKMYLMFVLNRLDVLPFEDTAFLQSYSWMYKTDDLKANSIKKKCKKWKPFSSIAARYLYEALDMGLTKDEFHLFK